MIKDKIIKIKKNVKYSICSCGKSDKLPYCDNNHRKYNAENNCSYKSVKIISEENVVIELSAITLSILHLLLYSQVFSEGKNVCIWHELHMNYETDNNV